MKMVRKNGRNPGRKRIGDLACTAGVADEACALGGW